MIADIRDQLVEARRLGSDALVRERAAECCETEATEYNRGARQKEMNEGVT